MKRTFLLIAFIVILASCNNSRVAELEAENIALKVTIEQLTEKIKLARAQEEQAQEVAIMAQRLAEDQVMKAQEAVENARRQVK